MSTTAADRIVVASDFHLTPERPREIEVFVEFTETAVRGAREFHVLGDLFEFWVGRSQLRVAGHDRVFAALRALAAAGTAVVLYHGNRDYLLGAPEAAAASGTVVGEERELEAFGRRYLLLHGDSLCTLDVEYQRTKVWLRSAPALAFARVLPLGALLRVAALLRRTSKRSTATRPAEQMELVGDAVRSRFGSPRRYDALICGHVHHPGPRDYAEGGPPLPVHVLGDWHEGGVYAVIDAAGPRLERFVPAGLAAPRGGR